MIALTVVQLHPSNAEAVNLLTSCVRTNATITHQLSCTVAVPKAQGIFALEVRRALPMTPCTPAWHYSQLCGSPRGDLIPQSGAYNLKHLLISTVALGKKHRHPIQSLTVEYTACCSLSEPLPKRNIDYTVTADLFKWASSSVLQLWLQFASLGYEPEWPWTELKHITCEPRRPSLLGQSKKSN